MHNRFRGALVVIERDPNTSKIYDRSEWQGFHDEREMDRFWRKVSQVYPHLEVYRVHPDAGNNPPDQPKLKGKLWCPYCSSYRNFNYSSYTGYTTCEICTISTKDFWVNKFNEVIRSRPKPDPQSNEKAEARRVRRERRKRAQKKGEVK